MTEAPSHLITRPRGVTRVLRLVANGDQCYALSYDVPAELDMCHECGCTNIYGCAGGCSWVDLEHTMCSRCFTRSMLPKARE